MASIDPVAYLREIPPFRELPAPLFDEAAGKLDVAYHPAGTWLARVDRAPLEHLWVIRKGAVRLERNGQTIQVLEEGESFGYTSLITGKASLDVVVEDDLVAYRIPGAEFQRLLSDAHFAGHFAVGLSARLRSSLEHSPVATFPADLSVEVGQLVRRGPVWVDEATTIAAAARVMRDERISSVLVRTEPPGIVTDRDFRNRVLAEGLGPTELVTRVFSRPIQTVEAATPTYEAWRQFLDSGVHHLPVVKGGEIVGVLTSSDLLRATAQGPVAVLRRVERLASRDALPGYAAHVKEMTSALLSGGLDAMIIAGFVSRLNDALVKRILTWGEAELGPPPAPYAWIVLGSEGRMEQTLLTDQDNALIYADEGKPQQKWFQSLAERANQDLQAAGFPECPGGYMAQKWQGPLSAWKERFGAWMDVPKPTALLEASIFFDYRTVHGGLDLSPLEDVIGGAPSKVSFLRHMASTALEFHPPPMLLLRLKGASSTVDLKRHGISPIVFLARCYALEVKCRSRNTMERLEAAALSGAMDKEHLGMIGEAFRFLVGLRLRLQLKQLQAGVAPANAVHLSDLSAIERSRLKDSLHAVHVWQGQAAQHFQTEF
jgi:CBS domain-containing protein